MATQATDRVAAPHRGEVRLHPLARRRLKAHHRIGWCTTQRRHERLELADTSGAALLGEFAQQHRHRDPVRLGRGQPCPDVVLLRCQLGRPLVPRCVLRLSALQEPHRLRNSMIEATGPSRTVTVPFEPY